MNEKYDQLLDKIYNMEYQVNNMRRQIEDLCRERDNYKYRLEEFDILNRRINSMSLESTIANISQQIYDLEQKYSDKTTNDQIKEYIQRYFDSNAISLYEKIN